MKRSLSRFHSLLLVAASLALSPFAGGFSDAEWTDQQAFTVDHSGVLKIALPVETLDRARPDLRDLRIVGPDGAEHPFAILRPSTAPAHWIPAAGFSVALQEGATVLSIDAGEEKNWEAIDLSTRSPSFLKAVQVEASTDGKSWEERATGLPLFRQDDAERTTLALPPAPARYFRLTLNDHRQSPIIVTGARLRQPAFEQIALEPVRIRIVRTEEYATETALTLDLGAAQLDWEAIELGVTDPLFTRQVRASLRQWHEGQIEERTLATDTIFRLKLGDAPVSEKTRVLLATAIPSREMVLHIENGDSPPLRWGEITGSRRVVYAAFEAPAAGRYILWSGNNQAPVLHYDLARLAEPLRRLPPVKIDFETATKNPHYLHADPLAGLALMGAPIKEEDWTHRRAVQLERPGVQLLELDLAALSTTQSSLADVRLVTPAGQVPYLLERTALARAVELPVKLEREAARPNQSGWQVSLPFSGAPLTQLVLTTNAPLFQREIHITERRETNHGETYQVELGHALWQRTPQDAQATLAVTLAPP